MLYFPPLLSSYRKEIALLFAALLLQSLGQVAIAQDATVIRKFLRSEEPALRSQGVRILAAEGSKAHDFVKDLLPLLKDKDDQVRYDVVSALGAVGQGPSADAVIRALLETRKDPHWRVKNASEFSLRNLASFAPIVLVEALNDPSEAVRSGAAMGLQSLDESAIPAVAKVLGSSDPILRQWAAARLGQFASLTKEAEQTLSRIAKEDQDWYVRRNARQALRKVQASSSVPQRSLFMGNFEFEDKTARASIKLKDLFPNETSYNLFYQSKANEKRHDPAIIKKPKSLEEVGIASDLTVGQDLWILTPEYRYEVVCTQLEVPDGQVNSYDVLKAEFQVKGKTRLGDYWPQKIDPSWVPNLLSTKRFPESQDWEVISASTEERTFASKAARERYAQVIRQPFYSKAEGMECASPDKFLDLQIIENPKRGRAMLIQFDTCEEAEFIQKEIMVFWKDKSGQWEQVGGASDQGVVPFIDVNGDGIPEVIGGAGYKDVGLWTLYPEFELMSMKSSGV